MAGPLARSLRRGRRSIARPFVPLVPGVTFVKFNDVEDLRQQFDASVCAICMETIQGEGGICPVDPEFLAPLRD